MELLPSGLPEHVEDHEDLARFLTQSNQFNAFMAKPSGFLPNPKYRNTSVFRIGNDPARLREVWDQTSAGDRTLKAVAISKAKQVRSIELDVLAAEPPAAHANIEGWPWVQNDPELQKARQVELAAQIAAEAELVRV